MQNDHQEILGFYLKKTLILKFCIFEKYIDFYFKFNFDAVFFLWIDWTERLSYYVDEFHLSYRYRVKSTEKGQQAEFLNLNIFILHPILNMHI